MTLPTRAEIRAILEPYRIAGKPWPDDLINALIDMRLRPGWEAREKKLRVFEEWDNRADDCMEPEHATLRDDLRACAEALAKVRDTVTELLAAEAGSPHPDHVRLASAANAANRALARPGVQEALK